MAAGGAFSASAVSCAIPSPLTVQNASGLGLLLAGHRSPIKAVCFLAVDAARREAYFASGGDDRTLRLWAIPTDAGRGSSRARCVQCVEAAHDMPVNCIAAPRARRVELPENTAGFLFASGGADYAIKIWALERSGESGESGESGSGAPYRMALRQTLSTKQPRFFPLCLALVALPGQAGTANTPRPWLLAAAGTSNRIQVYVGAERGDGAVAFAVQASLAGHEDWVRSLDFGWEGQDGQDGQGGDLLLASASQDKYVRLWRIHRGAGGAETTAAVPQSDVASPSNKVHRLQAGPDDVYTVTFEALLLGHEDWIYSARWDAPRPTSASSSASSPNSTLRLLTASADNSLAVWAPDTASGIWVTTARLGELSKEKGATSATGSTGGFWTGLWGPRNNEPERGQSIVTLGRTGSWRQWTLDDATEAWTQAVGVSGHLGAVTGIAWARDGSYLLSASSDQTTRLHAAWRAGERSSWHEMARPQIHGYDLNCIDSLGATQFVSGADEKLMRVFQEPKTVARLLAGLSGDPNAAGSIAALPDAADMPVLGLSNKAVDTAVEEAATATATSTSPLGTAPPPEDVLARSTLWPEAEKLYGHGYELSCLAASRDGRLIASACRAASLNHAVVRLFATAPRWTELRPPLAAHTLTVTRLRFSLDGRFLLSVGRDRQWVVWERGAGEDGNETFTLFQANKAHARMILDAAWAPPLDEQNNRAVFATAGRDKLVKVWARTEGKAEESQESQESKESKESKFSLATTIPQDHPVTAVDFFARPSTAAQLVLAVGTEAGRLAVVHLDAASLAVAAVRSLDPSLWLAQAVLQLAWRPDTGKADEQEDKDGIDLAVAGEDASLRVYRIGI